MAVVAGVVFFTIRALLALFPALTAGYPIKKWAAAAALIAAAFYLLLSGAEVATQRSFFMAAVVLIAVIVDRRAITFRTLAVAALVVLAIAPEALVHRISLNSSITSASRSFVPLGMRCSRMCRVSAAISSRLSAILLGMKRMHLAANFRATSSLRSDHVAAYRGACGSCGVRVGRGQNRKPRMGEEFGRLS
ncbi:Competence protein [Bradyrhizobium brasilense]|uniref:Competence protein n=1 Tax=Bradyrhizobium brasilense TaxID=1419277 RepID=A0A1G7HPH8_9BRAD|nr:Competence protein [Bradyrhizobium brasilense]